MDRKKFKKYPRGIEILVGGIVLNKEGKILLAKSPKWSNKWGICGGHIEAGEKMAAAIKREIKEETGLDTKTRYFFNFGEMIGPKDFHREAHFIYLDCVLNVIGGKIKLNKELNNYCWVTPAKALKMNLGGASADAVIKYLKLRRRNKK
jgi:8-oxo-dGTP pyrophosphatase MutT (NUDIX family)